MIDLQRGPLDRYGPFWTTRMTWSSLPRTEFKMQLVTGPRKGGKAMVRGLCANLVRECVQVSKKN